ncbi:metal-dependent hydrolase [Amnibacterium sp.]|uniref:metal-dependent hydrolase n=1 Tax=Amnibacterium sp. TaxID=1872496 RepID=UPI003F7C4569
MAGVMGVNHATSGAAVWFAATAALPSFGTDVYPLSPAGVLSGAVVCAGAALLPDADHHSGTIAHSVPVVGKLVARSIEDASGGHRHGFHTVLAGALVTLLAVLIGRFAMPVPVLGSVPIGPAIATVGLICFAVKARELVRSWAAAWLIGVVAAAAVVVFAPDNPTWFPIAVGLGFLTHIAGDLLTVEGVPSLTWPVQVTPPKLWTRTPVLNAVWKRNGYIAVPVLGHAGSWRETVLGGFLGLYCIYAVVVVVARAAHVPLTALG